MHCAAMQLNCIVLPSDAQNYKRAVTNIRRGGSAATICLMTGVVRSAMPYTAQLYSTETASSVNHSVPYTVWLSFDQDQRRGSDQ